MKKHALNAPGVVLARKTLKKIHYGRGFTYLNANVRKCIPDYLWKNVEIIAKSSGLTMKSGGLKDKIKGLFGAAKDESKPFVETVGMDREVLELFCYVIFEKAEMSEMDLYQLSKKNVP